MRERSSLSYLCLSFVLILTLCISSAVLVSCQSGMGVNGGPTLFRGAIGGTALSEGQPLPGVTVTITSPPTASVSVITNVKGEYLFAGLRPGRYVIRFELQGVSFRQYQVDVSSRRMRVDASMMNSSVAEAITVTADSPGVQELYVAAAAPPPGMMASVVGGVAYGYGEGENRETYAAVPESAFVKAAEKPLSTFSIDVDRASYSNIRRFLTQGQLPPVNAVRIEEMINYFPYDYAPPTDTQPFAVHSETTACPWNDKSRLLRIGIQGRKIDPWAMKPNNLVFLIDVSGSMQTPDKLPLVKSSLRLLIEQLRAQDTVALVAYAGAAGLVLPPTSGADKQTIIDAIEDLDAGGSTAGGEGILLAYEVAKNSFLKEGNNRVILATDGDFNVGITNDGDLERLIEQKRREGVYLTVLGFGTGNLQDAKMELLADKGNGNYAYVDTLMEAKKVFVHELGGTLLTIAKDVKIQIEFDPSAVDSYRLVGYENRLLNDRDFEDDSKDAGELGSGHSVTALYEVVLNAGLVGSKSTSLTFGTIKLRYKQPNEETSRLTSAVLKDEGRGWFEASSETRFAAAVAEFGMLLRSSEFRGTSTMDDVAQWSKTGQGVDLDGYRREFIRMVETALTLKAEQQARAEQQAIPH